MKNKNFGVKIYYTGFCTHQVKAKNKDEAINKARKIPINKNEMFSNLENWVQLGFSMGLDKQLKSGYNTSVKSLGDIISESYSPSLSLQGERYSPGEPTE